MNADEHAHGNEVSEAPECRTSRKKAFTVSKKYLVLPIQNEGEKGKLTLQFDGKVVLDYEVALAPVSKDVDWYAFFSLQRFNGRSAQVVASSATKEGFALVEQSDTIQGEEKFYKERFRPQFHFTSRTGWLNDPNGLIFLRANTTCITSTIPRRCLGAT